MYSIPVLYFNISSFVASTAVRGNALNLWVWRGMSNWVGVYISLIATITLCSYLVWV